MYLPRQIILHLEEKDEGMDMQVKMTFLLLHSEHHNSVLYDFRDILSSWTELGIKDQMLSYLRVAFFTFLSFKIHSLQLSPSAKPCRFSKIIEVLWNKEQNLSKSTHVKEDLCSEPLETCLGYWELVAWKRHQDFLCWKQQPTVSSTASPLFLFKPIPILMWQVKKSLPCTFLIFI